ncbi:tol-pal system-associated acyl-CoA thioesterase [Polymorphum gilvum]|uniref:Thioesterase superfamily protein n=1 Tax=Polymorphum gilvum (strain LMG 25793 / CGMCC 1.9160 / SL003B-26A1) TaxID=991905 RepID=F2IX58_POLGS|nr:tol-pal system-associated acyl-CoA thioesterase [Polymorphum gilvum]ADZ69349.1 Thioesterase superfamily protein [Polymorphum gilvum SL003B-26A1]
MTARWPDLSGRLSDGSHVLAVRVYYEDTDFTGVVYHGAYVKFFERGRSDFLRLAGVHHHALAEGQHGSALAFAVRHMDIDFLKPARIDDVLEIGTRLVELRGARIVLLQEAQRDGDLIASAAVTVAVIGADGRPTRLPRTIADRLRPA